MTASSLALCFYLGTSVFTAPAVGGAKCVKPAARPEAAVGLLSAKARVRPGRVAARMPSTGGKPGRARFPEGQVRLRKGIFASLDRARFFEESNESIYHENKKNPWHAFALAMLPSLVYKPLAIGLSWYYTDTKKNKPQVGFIAAVPTAGFGSFYSEFYWAGAISIIGDLAGSSLMAWYFYDEHQDRNQPGGSQTKLFAGLGIAAFCWVFDMIMGPVGALYFNKKLRRKYLSEAPAQRYYHMPIFPETGLAEIGPRPAAVRPVLAGYAARF